VVGLRGNKATGEYRKRRDDNYLLALPGSFGNVEIVLGLSNVMFLYRRNKATKNATRHTEHVPSNSKLIDPNDVNA
jgi:hypothetical protein